MKYRYHTKVGTFEIRGQTTNRNRFVLCLGEQCYGSYATAQAAAADAAAHNIGHAVWDHAAEIEVPADLSEWEQCGSG